ncbi:MAG: hypothetical protein SFV21_03825 [Rhodospirillaceae bacterium]|nr:hypothetical protein [Rhodospirillaceae bacterium]
MADGTAKASLKPDDGYAAPFFKSDTDRAVLLKDLMTDNIVTALINLGAETWATRRRLMTVERLLDEKGSITREMIEQYLPSAEVAAEWAKDRDAFIASVFDVLARRGDIPANAKMKY